MPPLAPNCLHIGTCAEADAAVKEFAIRQGFSWRASTHGDRVTTPAAASLPHAVLHVVLRARRTR